MRIVLGLEYDGSRFSGWQKQMGLRTVQASLEVALTKVANESIRVVCAGRTDPGVHASRQVVHFDTKAERTERNWLFGTNSYLPSDVAVKWVHFTDETFSARFSALSRHYRYYIVNAPIRSALHANKVTWHYRQLDDQKMHLASQALLGEHDFSSFRARSCQSKTPMRCIQSIRVRRINSWVILDIKANAFLHHMVRNIMGALMAVGSGRESIEWIADVLAAKNRGLAAETAPSYGLYLVNTLYPEHFHLPMIPAYPFGLPGQ